MTDIGVWEIQDNGTPGRLARVEIPLEKHLEDWIDANPDLLEAGLRIVGRQVQVDAGRLDLLAVDLQKRWVVIEVKRSTLYREAVAQALDYAACIAHMPAEDLRRKLKAGVAVDVPDERDVRVFVVGAGKDQNLGRLVEFLDGRLNVPISVVSYWVHIVGGQRVLVRELGESEPLVAASVSTAPTSDDVASQVQSGALGPEIKAIYDSAVRHGIYPKPFRFSIMFTPPFLKTRCLLTVPTTTSPSGHLRVWVEPAAFAKFYGVDETLVTDQLGEQGWRQLAPGDAEKLAEGLDRLFAIIDQNSGNATAPV